MVAKTKQTFKVGQFVVYPVHGVGQIKAIETQKIADKKIDLIVIEFEKNRMTLRVPVSKAEISGLRAIVSSKEMDEAIQSAKKSPSIKRVIWSRRAQQYEEKINSGNPMELADVIRDLQRREATDIMTFSSRQVYTKALYRMAEEFAVIHKTNPDSAAEKIEKILGIPKEIDIDLNEDDKLQIEEFSEEDD